LTNGLPEARIKKFIECAVPMVARGAGLFCALPRFGWV